MEIKLIRTILFRDPNGNDLRLTLGKIKNKEEYNQFMGFANNDDRGFRWRFVGQKIPMPIRSYEWFNGFPEYVMVPWVKSHGYNVVACTNHITGAVYVVKGNTPEPSKANAPKLTTAQEAHSNAISPAVQQYMAEIKKAKDNGMTSCYISSGFGKPPVEAIQTLLDAGYDICFHSYGKGYGDWFVQAYWQRSCEKGKIFVGDFIGAKNEVTIGYYKNA